MSSFSFRHPNRQITQIPVTSFPKHFLFLLLLQAPPVLNPFQYSANMSSKPLRCLYTMDGQGFDYSTSYKYNGGNRAISAPVTRCIYSKDGQGFDYTPSYIYSNAPTLTVVHEVASSGGDATDAQGLIQYSTGNTLASDKSMPAASEPFNANAKPFRCVYDMGQRPPPIMFRSSRSSSSTLSLPSLFRRLSAFSTSS